MTDAAPRIWAFHAGPFVGYFVGKEEVGTFVSEYILRAEHERIVAETRREALEEAAKACDRLASDPRMCNAARRKAAGQCAAAIRAMKGDDNG